MWHMITEHSTSELEELTVYVLYVINIGIEGCISNMLN